MLGQLIVRYGESHLRKLDRGSFAESLVFFDSTKVVVHTSDLPEFLSSFALEELEELIRGEFFELNFIPDTPICVSYKNGRGEIESDFNFIRDKLEVRGTILEPHEMLSYFLRKIFPHKSSFHEILNRVKILRFEDALNVPPITFVEGLKERIVSTGFSEKCCKEITEYFSPQLSPKLEKLFHYDFRRGEYGLVGESPIKEDVSIRLPVQLKGKAPFKFLPGSYLTAMLDTAFEIELAAKFGGSIRHGEIGSACAKHFYDSAFVIRQSELDQFKMFNDVIFKGVPNISNAVERGEKNLIDLIPVIQRRTKFSKWAGEIPKDGDLLAEYVRAISEKTWAEKIPTKSVKFGLFSTVGITAEHCLTPFGIPGLATAGCLAIGAIDTFLFDKVVKGWKPSIYVDEIKSLTQPE